MLQAYASVQLNADLGLSDYVYGLGSGIFFLGYMVFQVTLIVYSPHTSHMHCGSCVFSLREVSLVGWPSILLEPQAVST